MKILCTISFLLLSACSSSNTSSDSANNDPIQNNISLRSAKLSPELSCSTLKDTVITNWVEQYFSLDVIAVDNTIASVTSATSESTTQANNTTPDTISQTNTQEAGVDEADKIKTDTSGNFFIAQYDQLVIVDGFPASQLNELSNINLGGFIYGLFLDESTHRLFAITRPSNSTIDTASLNASIQPSSNNLAHTALIEIDISQLSQPLIVNTIQLSGHYLSTRKVNEKIHILTNQHIPLSFYSDQTLRSIQNEYYDADSNNNESKQLELKQQAINYLKTQINDSDIETYLPYVASSKTNSLNHIPCQSIYSPEVTLINNNLTSVFSYNSSTQNTQQTAIIGSGWITYASTDNLYLVQSSNFWWWSNNQAHESAIHHFDITQDQPRFIATGTVPGYVHNQFSLSEYNGNLRVASTEFNPSSNVRSTNHLFILNVDDGIMKTIGSVTNYANNEVIQSARFIENKAFVVTFEQIDPLFAFDLSDPTSPRIRSELKIPGFSQYIHPLSNTHLLTIGRDGDETGTNNNMAIKLFNVSDLDNIYEQATYVPTLGNGFSWSNVGWDHHAISFLPEKSMFSLPINSYSNSNSSSNFNGVMAFKYSLTEGTLTEEFRTDHSSIMTDQINNCDSSKVYCSSWYYRWMARLNRSVFITSGDDVYLYSLSNIGFKANLLGSNTNTSILFNLPQGYYGWGNPTLLTQ